LLYYDFLSYIEDSHLQLRIPFTPKADGPISTRPVSTRYTPHSASSRKSMFSNWKYLLLMIIVGIAIIVLFSYISTSTVFGVGRRNVGETTSFQGGSPRCRKGSHNTATIVGLSGIQCLRRLDTLQAIRADTSSVTLSGVNGGVLAIQECLSYDAGKRSCEGSCTTRILTCL